VSETETGVTASAVAEAFAAEGAEAKRRVFILVSLGRGLTEFAEVFCAFRHPRMILTERRQDVKPMEGKGEAMRGWSLAGVKVRGKS
jgi:hypothetical protein